MASAVAGERGRKAHNGNLRAKHPAGSKAEPQAKPLLKLKHLWFLDVQSKPQICPLFYNLKTQRKFKKSFVLSLQKIMGGHETKGA